MHDSFVRLEQEILDIQFSLRYFFVRNFIGKGIDGYLTNDRVLITKQAAKQLKTIQMEVSKDGYNIAVYDAYRPVKAVQHFIRWRHDKSIENKAIFYPNLSKEEIFTGGFIGERSFHSKGSTIDLTLIKKGEKLLDEPRLSFRTLKSGRTIPFYDDNSVDMGSSFDLCDSVSYGESDEVSEEQYKLRKYLRDVMIKHGFVPIKEEWWHFTLRNEPFPDTYFDFDIKKT
ncbi:MAG: M15 family metallopeptidase [Rickettsiales bacterium]|nr:M15 family metallopeptidase [Rickettsiales bacterium]